MSKAVVKRSIMLAAVFTMAFAAFVAFAPASVYAAEVTLRFVVGSTTYTRNGVSETIEAAPFNQDGRVMVPLRAVGEALDATFAFENNVAIVSTDDVTLELPIGVELAGGMGTPIIVEGRTFVPLGFIAEALGATPRWDSAASAAYIYVGGEPPAAPAPAETPAPAAPAEGENTPGILVASGDVSGAMIVVGNDPSVWPFSYSNEEGDIAFVPVPGETYRVSFNVTNHFNAGWRVRWGLGTNIFGSPANTQADIDTVNDYRVSPDQVATHIPAHFIEDVERQTDYTLVVDVTFDGSEGAEGLIGNIGLTGHAGESSFDVNWITVEHNGNVIASWHR